MGLCQYKDVFGKPGQGVHSIRLGGIAVVDAGLTVLAAWGLAAVWGVSFWKALVCLLGLGVLAHWLFCVDTRLNVLLLGKTT